MKRPGRFKKLHIDPGVRDAAAHGISNATLAGVVFGLLPKIAAGLSVTIYAVQFGAMIWRGYKRARAWLRRRKRRKQQGRGQRRFRARKGRARRRCHYK